MIHNLWLGVFEKNESYPKAIALSSTVNWIAGSEEVANLWIRRGHKSFDDNYLMNKSWADKETPSTSHVSPKGTSSSKSFHAAIDDSEQKQQAIIKINNTHREKLCFAQFITKRAARLLLTFFICLHYQLSSIHSINTYWEYRCLKNVIHQIDSKNEWLLLSVTFTAKFELVFVLTLENAFS